MQTLSMNSKPITKYIAWAAVVVVLAVAAFFIFKNNNASQQAAVYKTDALKAGASLTTTATKFPNHGNLSACLVGSTTPYIRVISPNGGETFTAGQQVTVKWMSCNIPTPTSMKVFLGYYVNGVLSGSEQLAGLATNTGTTAVTFDPGDFVPNGVFQYGNSFKITVTNGSTISTGTRDASDNLFTINESAVVVSNFVVVGNNPQVTTDSDGDNVKLTWKVKYDLTAWGDDIYIPKTVVQGTSSPTAGLTYTVYDETTSAVTTAGIESASSLSSAADDIDYYGYYTVNEGDTETFTGTISVQKGTINAGDFIKIQLDGIGYNLDGSGADYELNLVPPSDYDTFSDSIDA